MIILSIIAFVGILTGSFLLLRVSPAEFSENLLKLFAKEKTTIKAKVLKAARKNNPRGLKKLIAETKEILAATNRSGSFSFLCLVAFLLFAAGAFIGAITSNMLMVPVLAGGLSLLPFWYVVFTSSFYKKQLNAELETALSVITTSYLRSENIITAVDENITYLNPPVTDVFKAFLAQTKLINSNIRLALENLKNKIDSDVFQEWCDAVIACQEDRSLKSTLLPIVTKLSDIRVVGAELDYLFYEPMKEFITMAVLLLGNIPLMYFLNRDWYNTLMLTGIGKTILAVTAFVIFVSLAAVIRLAKPVEYRR